MDRINKIIENQLWKDAISDIKESENDRIFCRHGEAHLMDVARIAYIENLELGLGFDREIIYAASLVHDIGRSMRLSKGLPHEEAGALMAEKILVEADFSLNEIAEVTSAIRAHRSAETKDDSGLKGLLYRADKKSRLCLFCDVQRECNWSLEKMNLKIDI